MDLTRILIGEVLLVPLGLILIVLFRAKKNKNFNFKELFSINGVKEKLGKGGGKKKE